jgi:hypothetical protein
VPERIVGGSSKRVLMRKTHLGVISRGDVTSGTMRFSKNCFPCADDTAKKSQKNPSVIPAKAGIHFFQIVKKSMNPCYKGIHAFLR